MDISFHQDINTPYPVEVDLFILVQAPIAHHGEEGPPGFVFMVSYDTASNVS